MKNEEITVKVKKSAFVKLGIAFAVIAALALTILAYAFFFDLNSAVADGADREALASIQENLSKNGYLTALKRGSYAEYNSSSELLSSSDEYYSLCVSVAQRKSASEFLTVNYSEHDPDISFTVYP